MNIFSRFIRCLQIFLIVMTTAMAVGLQTSEASQLNVNEISAEDVIKRLYRDYAWQALGLDLDIPTVSGQTMSELERYFDSAISKLIVEDGECSERTEDVCRLDFNIIFDSQDAAAYEIKISQINTKDEIRVSFKYPSNRKAIKLVYKMVRTNKGWRIKDIYYESGRKSLSQILGKQSELKRN